MALTTVRGIAAAPGNLAPIEGAKVKIELIADPTRPASAFLVGGVQIFSTSTVLTATSDDEDLEPGEWIVELQPNDDPDLEPAGTVYRVTVEHKSARPPFYISVPTSLAVQDIDQILADPPGALPSAALSIEIEARIAADLALQAEFAAGIADEAEAREAADDLLESLIDSLATQADLAAETAARQAADTTLQTNIGAEATARAAADTTLQGNITAEATARANAVTAEANARAAADTALSGDISAEVTARGVAVAAVAANLTTETSRATGAEAGLAADISDEQDRAEAAEAALATSIAAHLADATAAHAASAVSFTPTGTIAATEAQAAIAEVAIDAAALVTAEATTRGNADTALSASLATEVSDRAAADTTIAANLAAEVVRAMAAEAAVASDVTALDGVTMKKAANGSDIANAGTFRTNLGLGTAATHPATDFLLSSDLGVTVASLTGGKIPTSQIPAIAFVSVTPVADQAARLALTSVQEGDVAVQADNSHAYMLGSGSPSINGSWFDITGSGGGVVMINGQTGVVVLDYNDVGADAAGSAAAAQAASLQILSNLADLDDPADARTNLGLGTAAVADTGDFDPAGAADALEATLGGAALLNVGTSAGTVAAGDDARFRFGLTSIALKTANWTAIASQLVLADANGGGFTVTLPATPATGTLVGVKKVDGTGNTVAIAAQGGDTLDGPSGLFLFGEMTLWLFDGSAWHDISGNMTPIWFSSFFAKADNLSGINAAAGRTNLGLGTAAVADTGDFDAAGDAAAVASDLAAHIADTTAAHAASAISFTAGGTISATDVQAAIAEVATDYVTADGLLIPKSVITAANQVLIGTGSATPDVLTVAASRVVGRKASGGLTTLDSTDLSTILGLGSAALVATSTLLQKANDLSDLNSVSTARSNLGLGGAALLAVGTGSGQVAAGDDSRITGATPKWNPTAKTTTYTAVAWDLVKGNATSGGFTVTLPTTPAAGTAVAVFKTDATANAVTIARGGSNTIEGGTSIAAASQYVGYVLVFDGTSDWTVLGIKYPVAYLTANFPLRANNLSDLASASTARTNLGLGGSAVLNVGTAASTVAAGDDSRIVNAARAAKNFTATKTANYTAAVGEVVRADASGGTITITMPASPSQGDRVTIVRIDQTQKTEVWIAANTGQNLNYGAAGPDLRHQGDSLTLIYDGVVSNTWITEAYSGSAAWTAYTPTFTNISSAAGTFRYKVIGRTLFVRWTFSAGTATATNLCYFSIPIGGTPAAGGQAGGGRVAQEGWSIGASNSALILNGGNNITASTSLVGNTGSACIELG